MKMRRIMATLLVLAMLLVCLPVQTFAEENGAYLLPSVMQQLQSIGVTQDGVIVFTEMDDLKLIIDEAKKNPDLLFVCYFNGSTGLTFNENLTIPANVQLNASTIHITVRSGRKLTIDGAVGVGNLEINGALMISQNGIVAVEHGLNIGSAGAVDLQGTVYMNEGLDAQISGEERISYGEGAKFFVSGTFKSEEHLQSIVEAAAANDHPNWYYHFSGTNVGIELMKPLNIPVNCVIEGGGAWSFGSRYGHPINIEGAFLCVFPGYTTGTIGCDVNILPGGTLAIGDVTSFGGKIHNLGVIEIATGFGEYSGCMQLPSLHNYTDTENGIYGEIHVMTKAGSPFPNEAIFGFNANDFTVEWQEADGISMWSLSKYQHPVAFAELPEEDYLEPRGEVYYFDSFHRLRTLARGDAVGSDKFYSFIYNGTDELVLEEMILPANAAVYVYDVTTRIASEETFSVYGSLFTDKLIVDGALSISGQTTVTEEVTVNGRIGAAGKLRLFAEAKVDGFEKITYGKDAVFERAYYIENEEQLRKACKEAESAEKKQIYGLYITTNEISLTEPLYVPQDCVIKTVDNEGVTFKGKAITLDGKLYISENSKINTDLTIQEAGRLDFYDREKQTNVTISGKLLNYGEVNIYEQLNITGTVDNRGEITVWYDDGGKIALAKPEVYVDGMGTETGAIYVVTDNTTLPKNAVMGLVEEDFRDVSYTVNNEHHHWILSGIKCVNGHTENIQPGVAPTCLDYGYSEGVFCSRCGEILVATEKLPPQGHYYGVDAKGDPDFWDTTCDVCEAERKVDKYRPTHSMYRMYNPNSGEHFYTGSMEERQNLVAAGWKYEGVGFTFPATTGKPVYRLYDKFNTFEHLYTMDEAEKDELLAKGWILEGVAFNSGREDEVPQYRLHNPNETIGAYHFTASAEERDTLIAAGWEYQGIGFYTCWQ